MALSHDRIRQFAEEYTAAWNSGVSTAVADCHTGESSIIINNGDPSVGHAALTEMAAGFHAAVPDLHLVCDSVFIAGSHVVFNWTFTGHDADTKNPLKVPGWEEWTLNDDCKITASLGWFDGEDYDRQIAGK